MYNIDLVHTFYSREWEKSAEFGSFSFKEENKRKFMKIWNLEFGKERKKERHWSRKK